MPNNYERDCFIFAWKENDKKRTPLVFIDLYFCDSDGNRGISPV